MGLKERLMEGGMKLMADPRIIKIVSNPKVMSVVMKGFQLRGQVEATVDAQVKSLARRFHLATREEVGELKQTIRTLEQSLRQVQADVKKP